MYTHPYLAQALAETHIQQLRRSARPTVVRRPLGLRHPRLATRLARLLQPAPGAQPQTTVCAPCQTC